MGSVPFEAPRGPVKLAFVGEAPSYEEIREGRPLVGPSGRVFNALLRSAGIEREHCWVGNLFEEQCPENECAAWLRDPAIYNPAKERLANELRAATPTVIVPLGGSALKPFIGQGDISAYRGSVLLGSDAMAGTKLVPTYHPALVLRQWKYYVVCVADIIKAAAEAERGPTITYPTRRLLIEPTLAEVRAFGDRLRKSGQPSGIDIETGWGQITCIGFSIGEEEAICIPFVDLRKPNRSYWGSTDLETQAWQEVKAMAEDPSISKVGQNFAGYDWFWLLLKKGIKVYGFNDDTRLLHHALYPELPKDLAFMGASYGQQGPWKTLGWRATEKRDE